MVRAEVRVRGFNRTINRRFHPMPSQIRTLVLAAVAAVAIASTGFAAPAAKQYQATLTDPPSGSGAVIKITKPSKVIVKIATSSVNISLKGSGVTDAMDQPVTLANNTAKVDFIRPNGMGVTVQFGFDIVNGKIKATFPVGISAFPGGPLAVGDPITIRGVQLEENGSGNKFAVAGLTVK
jgi:hypothetical protein